METEYIRDIIGASAIFSTFAMVWFGWAQENPPEKFRPILGIALGVCLLVAAFGFYLLIKNWGMPTRLTGWAPIIFGGVFLIETILIGLGAYVLTKRKKSIWIASWAVFIVALHFIPLSFVFADILYAIVGVVMIAGIAVSIYVARKTSKLSLNTLTCIVTGVLLFIFSLVYLVRFLI